MHMVIERKRANLELNGVVDCSAAFHLTLEHFAEDSILVLRVRTEEVNEKLDFNIELVSSLNPTWVATENWYTICRG